MRGIKFRVRDDDTKKVLGYELFNCCFNNGFAYYLIDDPEEILHSELGEPPMIKSLSSVGRLLREEHTGLKDKNGKEIYEGDIWQRDSFVGEIVFEHSGWLIKKRPESGCYSYPSFYSNAKYGEVIGNIYEEKG